MAGKKGRSGRKKLPSTLIKEAEEKLDVRLPGILEMLGDKAEAGNIEAAKYVVDRRRGRPRVFQVTEVGGTIIVRHKIPRPGDNIPQLTEEERQKLVAETIKVQLPKGSIEED